MVRYNYEEQRQYAVLLKPRTDKHGSIANNENELKLEIEEADKEMYFNKRQNKKYCF
ncbi:hypothetical protein ACTQ50_14450 [Blautia sp. Sow4_E7]|uniref:hypothetical protein n=1 Tax=Blautia sp. Sow4_E7 TaxID=3438749 RepID=UPI003F9063CA